MTKPRFMLDSNICLYLLQGSPEPIRTRMEECEPGEVVTSAIVYAEVLLGFAKRQADVRRARALFSVVQVLPFEAKAAQRYAELPFRRRTFDRLIAAHALSLELILVTSNERDFEDVEGLAVENWARP